MEITLIIVGGIVLISALGVASDIIKKALDSKKQHSPAQDEVIRALTQRIATLEEDRDRSATTVKKLEEDVGFMQRLLEKK